MTNRQQKMVDQELFAFEELVPITANPWDAFRIGYRHATEAAMSDFETRAWQIIDGDGLAPVPSDLWDALERLARSVNRSAAA